MIKIKSPAGSMVNIWDNPEELRARQDEGRELAQKHFPGDAIWERRLINLAQGVSKMPWDITKKLPGETIKKVVTDMMKNGFPADEPVDKTHLPREGCHACILKLGGRVPKDGQRAITVHGGVCAYCSKTGTIIPFIDYDWPKIGLRAVFD